MEKYYLMIPIWELFSVDSLKAVIFNASVSEYLKDMRSLGDRKRIHQALKWAKENPNFNFKSILKNAPVPFELKFSNTEIYNYLVEFKQFMEKEEFELLTDDRPVKKNEDFL